MVMSLSLWNDPLRAKRITLASKPKFGHHARQTKMRGSCFAVVYTDSQVAKPWLCLHWIQSLQKIQLGKVGGFMPSGATTYALKDYGLNRFTTH